MQAITGNYQAPNKGIQAWAVHWLRGPHGASPRYCLSEQLRYIRRAHGNHEAKEFRNYLLWLGVYPVKPTDTTHYHRESIHGIPSGL